MKIAIAILLCLATMLNYLDRLALGVVSLDIRREFVLDERDYGQIVALFMLAYAVMYAGSGYIVDRLGTKRGFAFFVTGWSLAQMLHGLAAGKWSLAAFRFGLGLTEPGNWPAAAKAVKEWFPAERRSLGIGIFNSGSSLGSALAQPLVATLAIWAGWRSAFVVTGALGLIWVMAWLFAYRTGPFASPVQLLKPNWQSIITQRACWTLILARFLTDPVIYFVSFWLPEYLRKERGFDLSMVAHYAWVPFVFGDVGYLFGGWLGGKLIDRGWKLPAARKAVLWLGAAFMPPAILAPWLPEAGMAIAVTCSALFGHALWVSNLLTIPTDVFADHEVGTASGLTGTGGALGGMLANLCTGYVVQRFSYAPIFLLAGLVHPVAAALVTWLLPDGYFKPRSGRAGGGGG
ncbi:MAG: MFS transporter [Bryobacteraceae bacterium]|nr:MFS transporter [Bryobacteraceae bacterium]